MTKNVDGRLLRWMKEFSEFLTTSHLTRTVFGLAVRSEAESRVDGDEADAGGGG